MPRWAFERHYSIPYPSISDPDNRSPPCSAPPHAGHPVHLHHRRPRRIAWAWFGATTYGHLDLAVAEAAGP